ncbi:MAG TPA: AAA family ATPase [Polyangiaceae bacterium]|nr:AAA family ATPase [Polyangiaceae bacterium]
MTNEQFPCSVCGTLFHPELAYQVEERHGRRADGEPEASVVYFCSLDCVSQSHESAGRAQCDVCNRTFTVELVSQVINHRGRRHHACSAQCRQRLLDQLNGPVLRPIAPKSVEPAAAPQEGIAASSSVQFVRAATSGPVRTATVTDLPPSSPSNPRSSPTTNPRPNPTGNLGPRDVTWQRMEAGFTGRTQVLAIFNHKGGTGKTTTSVTVAAGLAAKGQRVLLVDTDGQGNVAVSFGLQTEKTLYHVLVMGLDPHEAIVEVRPNLHVLPSNETLAAAELFLAGRQRRDRVLDSRLSALRSEYDSIVVDCSPSLSLLNQNALVFADGVLCPVACDYLSLVGVRQVLRTIKQVNRLLSHPVRLWGVLPTLYDSRARVCVEAYDTLRQHFGDRCLPPIRVASRAKEAPSQSQTIFEYAPDATAAKDYWQVVNLLLAESNELSMDNQRAAAGGAQ